MIFSHILSITGFLLCTISSLTYPKNKTDAFYAIGAAAVVFLGAILLTLIVIAERLNP